MRRVLFRLIRAEPDLGRCGIERPVCALPADVDGNGTDLRYGPNDVGRCRGSSTGWFATAIQCPSCRQQCLGLRSCPPRGAEVLSAAYRLAMAESALPALAGRCSQERVPAASPDPTIRRVGDLTHFCCRSALKSCPCSLQQNRTLYSFKSGHFYLFTTDWDRHRHVLRVAGVELHGLRPATRSEYGGALDDPTGVRSHSDVVLSCGVVSRLESSVDQRAAFAAFGSIGPEGGQGSGAGRLDQRGSEARMEPGSDDSTGARSVPANPRSRARTGFFFNNKAW